MSELIKALPLGVQDFSELRRSDFLYLDKTALIYELAVTTKKYFLSRPRRFGKTLLLSTFESLFKYGLRNFTGLAIEKLWTDKQTYPVIRLDFTACAKFQGLDDFLNKFRSLLYSCASDAGLTLHEPDGKGINTLVDQFESLLRDRATQDPVILIDEYDAPVNYCLDDQVLCKQVSNELSSFYAMPNQTGYLTIKEAKVEADPVVLNYPDHEVSKSMAQLFTEKVFSGQLPQEIIGETAWDLFGSGEIKDIVAKLNQILLAIDYERYPVKDEASVRSHLQMYLTGSNIQVSVEKHNAKGRSDLEFKVKDRYWVIELKFAKEQDNPKKLLDEAVELLKSRQYGEQHENRLQHLRLALVFSQKDRQFIEYTVI